MQLPSLFSRFKTLIRNFRLSRFLGTAGIAGLLLASIANGELIPKSLVAPPDTGIGGNFVVDIIVHNNAVWLGGSKGLNFSTDSGQTWLLANQGNGLPSVNVSALYGSPNGRLWVATNHSEMILGALTTLSDGVSYSDDNGFTWTQIDFSEDGLDIPFVFGGDRTIYDITGKGGASVNSDWVFFSAFAGGLLASRDGGINWRRLYPSADDSIQYNTPTEAPSLRNLEFSCAADTSHPDSLYLWVGSADGLFQYIFAEPQVKPSAKGVNQIAFCDVCSGDSNWVYYATEEGFTRGTKTGGPYITRTTANGLPGVTLSSIVELGGTIFAGTRASATGASTGLAISTNFGNSFTNSGFTQFVGANRTISDFAVVSGRLYLAGQEAGLHVSTDTGTSWTKVPIDLADTTLTNKRNVVHALASLGDTLWVGTDSGLVTLFLDPVGAIDSSRFHVFAESATSGARVIRVRTQVYGTDSLAVWTVNRALTGAGEPIIARSFGFRDTSFTHLRVGALSRDINFLGDSAFVVGGATGVLYGDVAGQELSLQYDVEEKRGTVVVDSLTGDTVTFMAVHGDTILLGARKGFARSLNRGSSWDITRINQDSLGADAVLRYDNSIFGITGDWFPTLGIQELPTDTVARVWTASRRAFDGTDGIIVGAQLDLILTDTLGNPLDTVPTRVWKTAYDETFAWNFAFHGDTTFAATDNGLLYTTFAPTNDSIFIDSEVEWDTVTLLDSAGVPLVLPGTAVYSVRAIPPYLWVGTGDRTIRMDLNTFDNQVAYAKTDTKSADDEVYAFPAPYSHGRDLAIDFRFVLDAPDEVTIEVYDFAMNLVKRVADNYALPAGNYPGSGSERITWDGLNGEGEKVAVGVYYFKVVLSGGETRWGKLAIIP